MPSNAFVALVSSCPTAEIKTSACLSIDAYPTNAGVQLKLCAHPVHIPSTPCAHPVPPFQRQHSSLHASTYSIQGIENDVSAQKGRSIIRVLLPCKLSSRSASPSPKYLSDYTKKQSYSRYIRQIAY